MSAIDDLKAKTDDQLQQQLGELKREQFNLRFQSATNQLEKPSRVREVRRTIARIKTLQNQRANAQSAQAKGENVRCPSASSPAPWFPTRVTRRSWSVSSGG
jgi:large subunit ribosomal protein L29